MTEPPIVCTLGSSELTARHAELLPGILARAVERREIPEGLIVRLEPTPGLLAQIGSMIEAERQCCRFLHFRVTAEPELGPIWLEVTGPAGTREFLSTFAAA